ncbi:MaoC-like dehydratase [Rhodovulum sp. PH10]|uniref:MaoC/PaaZ C-terminal domain-containing protein n=1 Tax=Rhodovulum sp. PH10 TaxID=1187851 RepID=UPI00027C2D9F|nr:MaoC/PaaZ C-terminal domain-containing protein [Rhodovulum sp. PH10]EJW11044.1 MaoC-like dehydratase [Rhodovulum sp. PH10]
MPIDPEALLAKKFPEVEHAYSVRDTILYALGVGAGHDPTDPHELRYVYEEDLFALPSMAVVLSHPGFWMREPDTGIDWRRLLHGEQGLVLHAPLPVAGKVIGRTRVTGLVDKGAAKGALLYSEREVIDAASGTLLATLSSTTVLRGDGGRGGTTDQAKAPHQIPEREPDETIALPTSPQAALIYRLSGDDNPLHADPKVAAAAGFPRPILHGLATYGLACRAILKMCCSDDPARLKALAVRFSAPVFPGETLRVAAWRDGRIVSFRASVAERGVTVLDNGRAEISAD